MDSTKAMNTSKAVIIVGLLMLPGRMFCAQQQITKLEPMTKQEASNLETSVAHSVVWQLHWWQGKTTAQIRNEIAASQPIAYTLCRSENQEPCAYLDSYQWKVTFTEIGDQYYGFDVTDYRALSRGDVAESKRSYLEALKREPAVLEKGLLRLRPEHLSVLAFETPGNPQYNMVTNTVVTNLLSRGKSETHRLFMAVDTLHKPLAIHIGGFNAQSPWIYYHIEGTPYLGMMLVDPATGRMLHDDLQYIHENPREAEYENVRRTVDESGATLPLSMSR